MLVSIDSLQALKINKIDKSNNGTSDIVIKRSGHITLNARDTVINVTKVKNKNNTLEVIPQIKKYLQYRNEDVLSIVKKVKTSKDKEVKSLVDYLDFDTEANLCITCCDKKEYDLEEDTYDSAQLEEEDKYFKENFDTTKTISVNIKRLKLFVTALDEMIKENPETGSIKINLSLDKQKLFVKAKMKDTGQEIFAWIQGSKVMNKKTMTELKYFSSKKVVRIFK